MKVSVIIPTYNRSRMVCRCLGSVLASSFRDLEAIVVDDCSPDSTSADVEALFAADGRVRVIRNPKNLMTAASRNAGAAAARGELLLFLDHDNEVAADMIGRLVAAFDATPGAGIVGALSLNVRADGSEMIWAASCDFNRFSSRPVNLYEGARLSELPADPELWPTTYAPNAFMTSRAAFDAAGGFDPSIGMMFDESDYGWRVKERGFSAFICTAARTRHLEHLDPAVDSRLRVLGIETPRRARAFGRNRVVFARRHFTFLQALCVALVAAPASALWYAAIALRERRADVAAAYARGTFDGIFGIPPREGE